MVISLVAVLLLNYSFRLTALAVQMSLFKNASANEQNNPVEFL